MHPLETYMNRTLFRSILCMVLAFSIPSLGLAYETAEIVSGKETYDLILELTPLEMKDLIPPAAADAVENVEGFKGLSYLIIFGIEKVVKGRLEKIRIEPRSSLEHIRDAVSNREFLEIFDHNSTVTEIQKTRFRIAVKNPEEHFGKISPEVLGKSRFRVSFQRYKKEPTTFIMMKSEKLS